MPTITQYTSQDELPAGTMIYGHTNPWLQSPDGEPLDILAALRSGQLVEEEFDVDCDTCNPGLLHGVVAPMDSDDGIQMCDNCQVFDGDLDAALALARKLDAGYTVWFEAA